MTHVSSAAKKEEPLATYELLECLDRTRLSSLFLEPSLTGPPLTNHSTDPLIYLPRPFVRHAVGSTSLPTVAASACPSPIPCIRACALHNHIVRVLLLPNVVCWMLVVGDRSRERTAVTVEKLAGRSGDRADLRQSTHADRPAAAYPARKPPGIRRRLFRPRLCKLLIWKGLRGPIGIGFAGRERAERHVGLMLCLYAHPTINAPAVWMITAARV